MMILYIEYLSFNVQVTKHAMNIAAIIDQDQLQNVIWSNLSNILNALIQTIFMILNAEKLVITSFSAEKFIGVDKPSW